jgi:hypothetical protein
VLRVGWRATISVLVVDHPFESAVAVYERLEKRGKGGEREAVGKGRTESFSQGGETDGGASRRSKRSPLRRLRIPRTARRRVRSVFASSKHERREKMPETATHFVERGSAILPFF